MFVSLQVGDKDQGIVIFDLLHRRFSGQRMLNNGMGVHTIPGGSGLPWVLWVSGGSEGLWPSEVHRGAVFLNPGAMSTLHNLLSGFLSLLERFGRSVLLLNGCLFGSWFLGHGLLALGIGLSWKLKMWVRFLFKTRAITLRNLDTKKSACEHLSFSTRLNSVSGKNHHTIADKIVCYQNFSGETWHGNSWCNKMNMKSLPSTFFGAIIY